VQELTRIGSPGRGLALWQREDSLLDDAEFYSLDDDRCVVAGALLRKRYDGGV
jgi:hypothetical protein